ncbi:hypothetical protein ACFSOZ_04040 [Mesorhizobium newzealandense]|uniref:Histone H1 n=3 Tax=Mesorhizobium TaxID=68287 RepID=A0ABW4WED6_9HYPH
MTDKHPKRPRDANQLARSIVDIATGEAPAEEDLKNKAAVELGRRGGKIGGRVRADRMSRRTKGRSSDAISCIRPLEKARRLGGFCCLDFRKSIVKSKSIWIGSSSDLASL